MQTLEIVASQARAVLDQSAPQLLGLNKRTRHAAVAIILHEAALSSTDPSPHVLFIKRAEKDGDPWSGQMAFPGGHLDPEDRDLRHAAVRETAEEIGLRLGTTEYLGAIDQVRASPRGLDLDMMVSPHVFLRPDIGRLRLNYEVAEVVSAPLNLLMSNRLHTVQTYNLSGTPTPFNGYRLPGGYFVWGLTYRMLQSLFQILDPSWQLPGEI